ncbi:hypothetical protein ACLB2K_002612 [Fragaria x ananassa]
MPAVGSCNGIVVTLIKQRSELRIVQEKLNDIMRATCSSQQYEEQKALHSSLNRLLAAQEKYWRQRSRITWLKDGDRNSSSFTEKQAIRSKNTIKGLLDEQEMWQTNWSCECLQVVCGGYNIKTGPGCSIELMKFDMGGSAAILGAAKAIGQIKPSGVETAMSLRKPPIPRLLLNNVSCMRNAQQILRHVNATVHDGGALVLMGTNGSGKSTFLRMLAGFSKPSAGQWFEVLEGKMGNSLPALELMGLGRLAKEKARMLSMGQRKRLQLARLLAIDRPIWLLDEPSVALDTDGVKLLEHIIAEHRKKGSIVIVATHLPIEIEDATYLRLQARFPRRMTLVDMLDRSDF